MSVTSFPDAMLATVEVIRAALVGRTEPYAAGVTVGTRVPSSRSLDAPAAFVMVRLDGHDSGGRHGADEAATLRVAVWHGTEEDAYDLARLVRSLLLAYAGDAKVRAFAPIAGPIPTSDPESGEPLSFFTVTARLRPITL